MANRFTALLALISLLLISMPLLALTAGDKPVNLKHHFEYLVDPSKDITLNDIINHPKSNTFSTIVNNPIKFTDGSIVWLKLNLEFNNANLGETYHLLAIGNHFREIKIFIPNGNGGFATHITGNQYPASQRVHDRPAYIFDIAPSATKHTIYARVTAGENMRLSKWMFMNEELLKTNYKLYTLFNFTALGILTGIMLFSLGIGITLKNANYFYYSAYLLMGTLTIMNNDGSAFYWLWPDNPELNSLSYSACYLGSAFSRLLVIYGFLEAKVSLPKLGAIIRYWLCFLGVIFLLILTPAFEGVGTHISAITWLASLIFSSLVSAFAIVKKLPLAKGLFIFLLLPFVVLFLQVLESIGISGSGSLAMLITKILFIFSAFLFSIIIALKIKHEDRRAYIAQHDELTGLESLALTEMRFDKAMSMARRYQWDILVLFIDLDKFKPVNDTFGHEVGDQLLQAVSARITGGIRKVDFASRIGGDEFLVIQTEFREARPITTLAEKISDELAKPFDINGHAITIGASIGIARFPYDGETLEELMVAADQAMYQVKNSGRNGVGVFSKNEPVPLANH